MGGSKTAGEGRSNTAAIIKTESEGRQKEEFDHSAIANHRSSTTDGCSTVMGDATRKPPRRKKILDRTKERSMDWEILEYAAVAAWPSGGEYPNRSLEPTEP